MPYDAEVEYLEGTGTQYIDTGVTLSSDMYVRCKFLVVEYNANSGCFGAEMGNTRRHSVSAWKYTNDILTFNYNGTSGFATGNAVYNVVRDVVMDENKLYVDGTLTLERNKQSVVTLGNCFAFWVGGTPGNQSLNPAKIRVYAFSIKDSGGNVLFDAIPVRIGQVGYMYDMVSGELFGNAGTGAFVVGPDKAD